MARYSKKHFQDFVAPLNMNGLQGRMLHVPRHHTRNREILVIYGHHSLLERWWSFVENLSAYGSVTVPDLPGFGGMDSFYKIHTKPTIDAYADYLASFIKLRYRRRRLTIIGISFGFVIVTRMLQKYPDLAKRVDILISAVGFAHADDFRFTKTRLFNYRFMSKLLTSGPSAKIFRYSALSAPVLRATYSRTHNAKHKFSVVSGSKSAFDTMMDFEIRLWHENDVRTHWSTTNQFLRLDNCKVQVPIPVWHIYSNDDHYFNNDIIEQHLRIIFSDVHMVQAAFQNHIPSVLADKKEAGTLLPKQIRDLLQAKQ